MYRSWRILRTLSAFSPQVVIPSNEPPTFPTTTTPSPTVDFGKLGSATIGATPGAGFAGAAAVAGGTAVAFNLLKANSKFVAAKYQLKRAIMELGPSGYPFESFISEVLKQIRAEWKKL